MSGTILIYKKDRRCKTGRRLINSYFYSWKQDAIEREIRFLKQQLYRSRDGYELVVKDSHCESA
jgi:hypothetical protein